MKRTSETKTALHESKTEFISYLEELKQLLPGKGFESFTEEWVTQAVNNASRLYQLKEILDKQIKKVINFQNKNFGNKYFFYFFRILKMMKAA